MSVEQDGIIDIISMDRLTREVTLTISDHLDWRDTGDHLLILQRKLNRYLAFIESGEIFEQYPVSKGRAIAISVVFHIAPDESALGFLAQAKRTVEGAGIGFRSEVFRGAVFN